MSCKHCTDQDGAPCYPVYGVAPHRHDDSGATVLLPRSEWPSNFSEDAGHAGLGTWWCPRCGDGKPASLMTANELRQIIREEVRAAMKPAYCGGPL